jgi:uncharacterized protein
MQFRLADTGSSYAITGYGADHVLVNGQRHTSSLIVTAERLIAPWPVAGYDALTETHFAELCALGADVVLLGTGAVLRFPHPRLTRGLAERGIGLEVMDTRAACRTYNVLAAEGRRVAAALLLGC